jgi:tRNA(adenine34) deaminase
MMPDVHERFMRMAIEEAEQAIAAGDFGVGSVLVSDGVVVARGRNLVNTDLDLTAHAETVALRNAGRELDRLVFSGYTLYTTYRPCPMCCGAILIAGISTLVIGATSDPETSSWGDYSTEAMIDWLGRAGDVQVISGVLAEECAAVRAEERPL